jgi:hypothetical protein
MKSLITGLTLLSALAACSSVIEGTSQEIVVNTNPTGAECTLLRQGTAIANVDPTPGAATIKKTKYDITIVCNKQGYQEATYLNHSGAAGATFGNIVLGGGIGWAVDSASGADNKYDSPLNITLVPEERRASAPSKARHIALQKKPSDYPGQSAGASDDAVATTETSDWPSSKR